MINKKIYFIIQTRDLTVFRNGKTLLDRVNLDIERGSLTMLLGHNGAGKSSIFRTLGALWSAPEGTIVKPGWWC